VQTFSRGALRLLSPVAKEQGVRYTSLLAQAGFFYYRKRLFTLSHNCANFKKIINRIISKVSLGGWYILLIKQ
jgi:hypothetical protein